MQTSPLKRDPQRILFIGGTGFVGAHIVRKAQARGHEITLFNRGITNPEEFPGVDRLVGDRDGGLSVLEGRNWDAVVDVAGYIPRLVQDSAKLLQDKVNRYVFVSTGDVYTDFVKIGIDEDYPLDTLDDPSSEDLTKHYGALKVLCEQAVINTFGDRATILRPGFIIGSGDHNAISAYWPMRILHGGEVLAPGAPTDPIQIIDVDDLAGFVVRILEQDISGTFNTLGPEAPLSMAEFLYGIRAVTSSKVNFTWVDANFLAEMGVSAMTEMAIWFPPLDDYPTPVPFEPGAKGLHRMSAHRAVAAGLTFRSLADTARSIIDEFHCRGVDWDPAPGPFGLSLERESAVLSAWRRGVVTPTRKDISPEGSQWRRDQK